MTRRYSIGAAAMVDVTWDIDKATLTFTPVRMTGHPPVNRLSAQVVQFPHQGPWREAPKEIARVLRLYREELASFAL